MALLVLLTDPAAVFHARREHLLTGGFRQRYESRYRRSRMKRFRTGAACALLVAVATSAGPEGTFSAQTAGSIVVRLAASAATPPGDGRLLLFVAKNATREPRFQVSATSLSTAQVFGLDVDGLNAGAERSFDARVLGYPIESLSDLPPGEYTVQALLHKY